MKEVISIEINGKPVVIGYSSMFIPTDAREQEQNHVFKLLRLRSEIDEEGDIFFFQCKEIMKNGELVNVWYLLPEHGYISVNSPLQDLYMNRAFDRNTTFDELVEAIFRDHFWVD